MILLFLLGLFIELYILCRIVYVLRCINIHLTDLVFYFRDSFYNNESKNYLKDSLDTISDELHVLNSKINEDVRNSC